MDQPPRWTLLKIAALTFALGASGCYVWKAQEQPVRKHLPSTKSIDSLVAAPQHTWISGTKNITQPVFNIRNLKVQTAIGIKEPLPPSLDYPGYPPLSAAGGDPELPELGRLFKTKAEEGAGSTNDGITGGRIFTSTKSGVPLIKVHPSQP